VSVFAESEVRREVRTGCPYCGTGCGLIAQVSGGRIVGVKGDLLHPVNRGSTCRKPLALPAAVIAPDRATVPLLRESRDSRWRERGWGEVTAELARRLRTVVSEAGPGAIAFYVSGQLLTEDYYAVNKLAKGFLGTNNVDSNSRLCMSSAVAAYTAALGADGPPPSYADIDRAEHLLIVGSNTSACHPILWSRIRRRQSEGATVTVIDPRTTPTARAADLHLQVRPGADLPLLSAILACLHADGMTDAVFLDRHVRGFAETLEAAAQWTPARTAECTGVPAELIHRAARMFGAAGSAMTLWSMGANQSTVGTLKNRALINLCLATGNIGRPGTGPLSLTGQPNAMGGRESGGLAGLLPGYRTVTDAADRAAMRRLWNIPADAPGISPLPGVPATELVDALEAGEVKVVWIVATNPVVSQPDAQRFAAALRQAELVIVQDVHHPTETSALAHVLLPAAGWGEKDGTQTNSERRITLMRKAVNPPGEALPDWKIFARVGRALGYREQFGWRSAAEVHDEYVRTTEGRPCDQTGLSHDRLERGGSRQWPIPARGLDRAAHSGTDRLYTDGRFPTDDGRARMVPTPHAEPADTPSEEFPLVLTTGRLPHQWHTMTRTGKSRELLAAEPEPFLSLHAADARRAGVRDGQSALIRSRRGRARIRVRVSDEVAEGVAFAPFHWGALHLPPASGALNNVLVRAVDPVSRQAELKATAVRVEPITPPPTATGGGPATHRLVVVGGGMAGHATIEALLSHAAPGRWEITLIGAEPDPPYNRMRLSTMLAGDVGEAELALRSPQWYADHGVTLRLGVPARVIEPHARTVELVDGERLRYDELVLATGSRPFVPRIPGIALQGVHVFRTRADTRTILEQARAATRAIVIGGGLLGIEAARALRGHGVRTTIVHKASHLMDKQLDAAAASLLARSLRGLNIGTITSAVTEAIEGGNAVERVRLASGETLDADLVVVAAGIVPNIDLAEAAGIETGRGILVDDELRTSAPHIRSVGECTEHRGMTYGLWSPLLEQTRVLGASLADQPAAFLGSATSTTLKVAGIDLFCGGRVNHQDEDDEELVALDTRRGHYRRLLINREGRLAGAILLGDLRDTQRLKALLTDHEEVPTELLEVVGVAGARDTSTDGLDQSMNICSCQAVTRGEIVHAIQHRNLTTLSQVAEHTRASTGCGGCRLDVERILAATTQDAAATNSNNRLEQPLAA
jgi:ferredoxin-nitrate reductase